MDKPVNYTREAFLHPMNLGFLIAAFTSAFFLAGVPTAMNIVFSVTFAVELIYLGLVPRTPRFQKYVNLRKFKERNSKFDERKIFGGLTEEAQERFLVLKHISALIRDNFQKLPYHSHGLLDSINTRIDSLLTSYMLLLDSNQRYSHYLNKSAERNLEEEIKAAQAEVEETNSEKLKHVIGRRLDILKKRLGKYGAAREKYQISESQLKTIEDTVKYIYEKSMTMSNLEEIEHQMDSLLMDLEDTDSVFDEMNHDLNHIPDYLSTMKDMELETMETGETVNRKKQRT